MALFNKNPTTWPDKIEENLCFQSLTVEEYNVSSDNKDSFSLSIVPPKIRYDGKIINDKNMCAEINNIVAEQKENILKFKDAKIVNYKGGRQEQLSINFGDQKVVLLGNTPDHFMSDLYYSIRERISNCINTKDA